MLDMQQAAPDRIYLFDNIKAGLIFLVVLGHMLELCLGGLRTYAYTLIYCFHMPLFIVISPGGFGKGSFTPMSSFS